MKTLKIDWMSNLLAVQGYLVSGHPTFAEKLDLSKETEVVIRHFRLKTSVLPEVFFISIDKKEDMATNFEKIMNSKAYHSIKTLFPQIRILTFTKGCAEFELDGIGIISKPKLLAKFKAVDVRYIQNLGSAKPVNVSSNDSFADWTRSNLTRDCVINDIDALLCPNNGNTGVLIELKRPKESIKTWTPYKNDSNNYKSSAGIAASTGLENRTIAYNENNQTLVGLHLNVHWNIENATLYSRFAITTPQEAIPPQLDNRIKLEDCFSSK